MTGYHADTQVEVFYRMERDGEGYFPVANFGARCLTPRFGMTDGWIVARVLEDWDPASGKKVHVYHTHELWSDRWGMPLNPKRERDMVMDYPPADVRPLTAPGAAAPVPTLSLLVVRWGGEETEFNVEQWGAASASTSSAYVSAFIDNTVYPTLGPDYEVHSIFVKSGAELARLNPASVCSVMRGKHKAGCYFLWPVMHQDGEVHESGMVDQACYFEAVRAFEACGVCTRFPHPSQLYRTLLAKDWQPTLCLMPSLRIPPSVTINRASVAACPERAAQLVVSGLAAVRIFRGESQLATALLELSTTPAMTTTAILVQDFAQNDFELRQFVIGGEVRHRVYSTFEWTDADGYFREFVKKDRQDAISSWMGGDAAAMACAERKASKLAKKWLGWLRTQSVEALPAIRMDILVKRVGVGKAEVFTLELTELGFSMLAWPQGPPLVFSALLASCVEDTGPSPLEAGRLKEGAAKLLAEAEVFASLGEAFSLPGGGFEPEGSSSNGGRSNNKRKRRGGASAGSGDVALSGDTRETYDVGGEVNGQHGQDSWG